MRRVLLLIFVPVIVGAILGVLEFEVNTSPQFKPRLPAVIGIVLCLLVVAAGSVAARIEFGTPWLPLGWTFVVIFVVFVIFLFSDISLPASLTSNAFPINTVLLVVFGIWFLVRLRRR